MYDTIALQRYCPYHLSAVQSCPSYVSQRKIIYHTKLIRSVSRKLYTRFKKKIIIFIAK
jgi:hypothetical protein